MVAGDCASATDEDSLSKAMRRKAEQNDFTFHGMPMSSKSFLQFNTPRLSSNLLKVGVKLGSNENEISVSANALRHLEFDRLRVSPVVQTRPLDPSLDDDDADATVDGQLLSHLVGEVSEVSLDEGGLK